MYNINQWFLKHNLKLNFNKTKYITFSQDKRTQPKINTLKIHKNNCNKNNNDACEENTKTESIKYLGITIYQFLK
ncbi:putative RNA-directed DNA polymerase [Aphis craccivora]|uniref:Putative RNA-directed DNA polymerase n=1 Tax=Aphis craccivora TaxID=307492 RepID=A0A6G0W3N2_APHCR|nr:putative RNA-directed DNA polymerase [Aphis craccivora]